MFYKHRSLRLMPALLIFLVMITDCLAWVLGADEVRIDTVVLQMPLDRLLLVRKGTEYCAVKFTQFRENEIARTGHALYELYLLGDGSEGLTGLAPESGELLDPRLYGVYPFQFTKEKKKKIIVCGDVKLLWHFDGALYFHGPDFHWPGSQEAELAPTPWKSISEVNVRDRRLKWYRYGMEQGNLLCRLSDGDESFLSDCKEYKPGP